MATSARPKRPPAYQLHKPSGRARVSIRGHDIWLGTYGSPESHERYNQIVARWAVGGPDAVDPMKRTPTIHVVDVTREFRLWSEGYHLDRQGRPSKAHKNVLGVCRRMRETYGELPAAEFRPRHLMLVRDSWIAEGLCVTTINDKTRLAVRAFQKAVALGLVPETVWRALTAVEPLKPGKCAARRPKKVKPVPDLVLQQTIERLPPILRAMVRVQLLTGMRSSELCAMTPGRIDTSGPLWIYRPEHHKSEEDGKDRVVQIGPKAQAVLAPFMLGRVPDVPMFSPREAESARREAQHAQRRTPIGQGNRPGTNRKSAPKRTPGLAYTEASYRKAIYRACDALHPPPEHLAKREGESERAWMARLTEDEKDELRRWRKAHRWFPHRVRHNTGTLVRREGGLEAAQAVLGHATLDVTEIYAEKNLELAAEAMLKVG